MLSTVDVALITDQLVDDKKKTSVGTFGWSADRHEFVPAFLSNITYGRFGLTVPPLHPKKERERDGTIS